MNALFSIKYMKKFSNFQTIVMINFPCNVEKEEKSLLHVEKSLDNFPQVKENFLSSLFEGKEIFLINEFNCQLIKFSFRSKGKMYIPLKEKQKFSFSPRKEKQFSQWLPKTPTKFIFNDFPSPFSFHQSPINSFPFSTFHFIKFSFSKTFPYSNGCLLFVVVFPTISGLVFHQEIAFLSSSSSSLLSASPPLLLLCPYCLLFCPYCLLFCPYCLLLVHYSLQLLFFVFPVNFPLSGQRSSVLSFINVLHFSRHFFYPQHNSRKIR